MAAFDRLRSFLTRYPRALGIIGAGFVLMSWVGEIWTVLTGPLPVLGQVTVATAKMVAAWRLPNLSAAWSLVSPTLTVVGIFLIVLVLAQGPLARYLESRRSGVQTVSTGPEVSPPAATTVAPSIEAVRVDDLTTPVASLDPRVKKPTWAAEQRQQPDDHDAEHKSVVDALEASSLALRGLVLTADETEPGTPESRRVANDASTAIQAAKDHDDAWHVHIPERRASSVVTTLQVMGHLPVPKSDWERFIEDTPVKVPKWRQELVWRVEYRLRQLQP